ncbi:DNase I-like protein [Polyporus arcularius HHB13444]|uniref:DNase I-like protein n=1 Tax=Polyporus arcularius HHB13444 TaxID=1314778 RepID=A0A5C3PZ10_9APHY|nr:DNase I-like protein [Polyporus arcularius HHB13444]
MNGAFARSNSSSGGSSQDKWMLLNQLMRQGRIAILALQETHYTELQAERLNGLFEGLMRVYVSPDPVSPTAARGVAFAVNLRIMRDDSVAINVHVPGRAMTLSLKRRRGSRLTVLNVYAPNVMAESVAFWNQIRQRAGEPNWVRPDLLLGDFNIVEDASDRAPARTDNSAAVQALQALLIKLGLVDGWRSRNGVARLFSYHQISSGSQSRIDRIYVSGATLSMSHSWDIRSSGIPTDHCLVSVAIADYNEPVKGLGRWRLPGALLIDNVFLTEAQKLGFEILEKVCPEGHQGREAQWRLHAYKVGVLTAARARAKKLISKWDRRLVALRKDISAVLKNLAIPAEERSAEAAILRDEESRLEQKRFQSCRDNMMIRDKIDGETISPYWLKSNGSAAVQEPIYELQVPTVPACNLILICFGLTKKLRYGTC